MKSLLTPSALKTLKNFKSSGRLLLAFDFDGTLSPISSRPDGAVLPEKIREQLERLNEVYPLAIISGRSAKDLQKKLGFTPRFLVGNHGIEGVPSWKNALEKAKRVCDRWRKQIERAQASLLVDSGVLIEYKKYSISLHYRNSRHKTLVRKKLLEIACGLDPLPRVVPGKSVLNLVPEGLPHKGAALEEVMRLCHCKKAIYVGDDATDEDVFRRNDECVMTVRVGQRKDSRARFYLRRQSQVSRFLEKMIAEANPSRRDRR